MKTERTLCLLARLTAERDMAEALKKEGKTLIRVSDKQLKIYWRNLELEINASEKDFISGPTQTVILWDRKTNKFYKETR